MDCSPPGSSVHGIVQARILEWVAISFSWEPSWPRESNPGLLHWQADSLPSEPPRKLFRYKKLECPWWALARKAEFFPAHLPNSGHKLGWEEEKGLPCQEAAVDTNVVKPKVPLGATGLVHTCAWGRDDSLTCELPSLPSFCPCWLPQTLSGGGWGWTWESVTLHHWVGKSGRLTIYFIKASFSISVIT